MLDVPPLQGRVNDLAGLLSPAQRQDLERKLEAFEQETSHQVVVLTVRSLDGEDVEGFSMRVVESWKLGHQGIDNGALITVSNGDRRARIEVGYGLEGVVPDAIAARIIRNVMIPSFRDGRMGEGIVRGAEAVMAAARGEEIPAELRPRADRRGGGDRVDVLLFCGIAGGLIGAFFARRSRIGAVAVASLAAFGLAYLIVHLLFDSIFAGFIGAFFGTIWSGVSGGGGRIIHLPGGGWGRTGGYGGGFGGGGFGGGFGGGGGGFGGGGASGSW